MLAESITELRTNIDLLSSFVPCLAVDADGIIRAVSPGIERICVSPVDKKLEDAFAITLEALGEHLSGRNQAALVGEYVGLDSKIRPALAQAIASPANDSALIVVTDLGTLRHAEEKRFNVTPYPIFRLAKDGLVLFSNDCAAQLFGRSLDGELFQDLFPATGRGELQKLFYGGDARKSTQLDLPAPRSLESSIHASEIRLFLTPDTGPEDHVYGRLAVIAWDPYKRHRDRLHKALDVANGWDDALRTMLDDLREIVPFDRANKNGKTDTTHTSLPAMISH